MTAPAAARPTLRATYRLQLGPHLDFDGARALIPYLRDLGISHLYLSPSLQARAGSTHGYDVIDPTRISEDLGGERAFRELAAAAHAAGMGVVLDIVPNHMAADDANPFWADPALRERFFDIDPSTGRHRRFFDIDDLVGVRQEDPLVFERTHGLVLSLAREGAVDALRIDHPDGLADPAGYLERLRDAGVETVWVEKILEGSERLRDWPVAGTVGYDFLADACALFVDPAAEPAFSALWEWVSGDARPFADVALDAKLEQATTTFAPELERLAASVDGEPEVGTLARAVASFPVYRAYVRPAEGAVDEADREAVGAARMPAGVAERLLLERPAPPDFVTRFQQTTPPVVAKGVEDTAFYRYARLLALCDVGCDPGRFGLSIDRFHERCLDRATRFPRALLATTTHDTKRSADVRARIAALTWMPEAWERFARRWLELTEPLRTGGAPDDIERYLLAQTLVSAWPIQLERVQGYMRKALREAKRNTSWTDVDESWEEAVDGFCGAVFEHPRLRSELDAFTSELAFCGERIALGMVALKLTAPGVPDIYQGDELPLHTLVDPDNRGPVDWEWSRAMLARLTGGAPPTPQTRKLWLTLRLLGLRIRRPRAFDGGSYEPVDAGEGAVAYMRGGEVLVIVCTRAAPPRSALNGVDGRWRDVLSGDERRLGASPPVAELVDEYGLAVLERL
ncbi:MAG: alpha-amylase family glycosyl hydrolase [Solirubrobacteraceae bacterium]